MFDFIAEYNQETVIIFYSKSKDAAPGRGAGEKKPSGTSFPRMPANFRKCLSDLYLGDRPATMGTLLVGVLPTVICVLRVGNLPAAVRMLLVGDLPCVV